ncbi:MAG: SLC13/DASS family transporter [Planctomycetota bacterium]|nr:MAG: SLC13/DASS family transporter [Planctomycetota bacterium]
MPPWLKIAICVVIPLIIWVLPSSILPLTDPTVVEHRVIVVFTAAVLFWILEPIPIFATSMLVLGLLVAMISDGAPNFLRSDGSETFGTVMRARDLMAYLADPTVILFLGGFFLAIAATKYRLDINLARVLLKPFGNRPAMVILGMMAVTAVFSMFMSNTATTAMMLAVLAPVAATMAHGDRGRIAMVLAVPVAANIGGMGTPIGTPPNAVAVATLRRMEEAQSVQVANGELEAVSLYVPSFAGWMLVAVPLVIVLMAIAWFLLLFLFKPEAKHLDLQFEGRWLKTPKAWVVYITGIVTIALWLVGQPLLGLSASVVGLFPVVVFCVTGVMTAKDVRSLSWDVLWLIAGGFALGGAMQASGLSANIVESIPFGALSPVILVIVAAGVTTLMATFMSNTATANLLIPLMAAMGVGLGGLSSVGGAMGLILAVTFAASLGMALPISTPPNAMAHATGMVESRHMSKNGVIIGVIGLTVMIGYVILAALLGMF